MLSLIARVIPKNYRNVTGRLASTKNQRLVGFESTLEKDFLLLLEFAPDVSGFDEQPITICYRDAHGQPRRYTPDVLVRFHAPDRPTELYEVKYRDDLRQNWAVYRPKFKAAWRYARQQRWRFRWVTEREVRTPRLSNARFLRRFRALNPPESDRALLLSMLAQARATTPEVLLQRCSHDQWQVAQLMTALWFLVATYQIQTDLGRPLTMRSVLHSVDEGEL